MHGFGVGAPFGQRIGLMKPRSRRGRIRVPLRFLVRAGARRTTSE